jgi:hypothetical protein
MPTRCSDQAQGIGIAVLALCAIACAGCTKKHGEAQNGASLDRSSETPRARPQGRSAPLKVTDDLILAIPLQYERSAIYHGEAARALIRT